MWAYAIGCDVQFDQFWIGAAADVALTNRRAEVTSSGPGPFTANVTSRHIGAARARAGYVSDDLPACAHCGLQRPPARSRGLLVKRYGYLTPLNRGSETIHVADAGWFLTKSYCCVNPSNSATAPLNTRLPTRINPIQGRMAYKTISTNRLFLTHSITRVETPAIARRR